MAQNYTFFGSKIEVPKLNLSNWAEFPETIELDDRKLLLFLNLLKIWCSLDITLCNYKCFKKKTFEVMLELKLTVAQNIYCYLNVTIVHKTSHVWTNEVCRFRSRGTVLKRSGPVHTPLHSCEALPRVNMDFE